MTTIAYRNGRLCADTQTSRGYTVILGMTKISKGKRGLGGACGLASFCEGFQAWIRGEREEPPIAETRDGDADCGLHIDPFGKITVYEMGGCFILETPYFAMGSGRDQALGAMHAGADSRMAVEAAIAHDAYTGGAITVLELD